VQNLADNGIGEATVNGGLLQNRGWASIHAVSLEGGRVSNDSRIHNLTYHSGGYNTSFAYGSPGPGSIGTLTIIGDATGINWGNVDNVAFSDNGSGILGITAFADVMGVGFSGIQAQNIDFTYGSVSLDLSALGAIGNENSFFGAFDSGFSLAALFGDASVDATNVNGIHVAWGDDFGWEEALFSFLSDSMDGWQYATTGGLVWGVHPTAVAIPEPTTLAMIGLGLAGLGYARRRMKK